MDADRIIDITIMLISMGGSAYLGYSAMKRMGLIRSTVVITVRGKKVVLTSDKAQLFHESAVDPNEIDASFDSIGGHSHVKEIIQRSVVVPFKFPQLFNSTLRKPAKGLLLYGPPGTGKTMLARAIAKEANAFFMDIHIESLFSKWVGQSEQNTSAIFKIARLCQPTIIFVDEIDSLLSERSENSSSAVYNNSKTIFLSQWDGFCSGDDTKIVVVGATNIPHVLDSAVLRRFSIQIEVPLPTSTERRSIFELTLREENINQIDVTRLVALTEGYSGSDLKALCTDACSVMVYQAVEQFSQNVLPLSANPTALNLTMNHFHEAIDAKKKKNYIPRANTR